MKQSNQKNNGSAVFLAGTFITLALAGCGNSDVSAVKATVLPQDSTHTYDTALSKRKSCKDDSWEISTDEANRKVVSYQCAFKDGAELIEALRLQKLADVQKEYQVYYSGLASSLEQIKQGPESSRKFLVEAQAKLDQAMADYTKEMDDLKDDPIRAMRVAQVRNEMGPLASAKASASHAQQSLKDAEDNLDSRVASIQSERERFERSEKSAVEAINTTYEGTAKASEVFTWFVRDGNVTPAWSGVELTKNDGSVTKLQQNWPFTIRHLLQYRGEDHVRSALNVPANVIPGKPPAAGAQP